MAYTNADDFADNASTSGTLPIGNQVQGNIELPNDKDWFRVTLQAGTTYVFDLTGADADFAIYDLESGRTLRDADLLTRHKRSPLDGRAVRAGVVRTISRGRTIFADGKILAEPGTGQFVTRAL